MRPRYVVGYEIGPYSHGHARIAYWTVEDSQTAATVTKTREKEEAQRIVDAMNAALVLPPANMELWPT